MPDTKTAGPDPWRVALPHTTAAVPIARALIRAAPEHSPATGARADADTAELLTAELVSNAVEHTSGGHGHPIELVVELRPAGCRVEVHDRGPAPPGDLGPAADCLPPDPWQVHGRGLLLVRTLSSNCGHRRTARGKAVRFTLPAPY